MPTETRSPRHLRPARDPRSARLIEVKLAPGVYRCGTVLGQVDAAAESGAFTLSVPGNAPFRLSAGTRGRADQTVLLRPDATAAEVRAALVQLPSCGSGNVSVEGPDGGPWVVTFRRTATTLGVAPGPSGTPAGVVEPVGPRGVPVATSGAVFAAYGAEHRDGTQVPRCLLAVDCEIDARGLVVGAIVRTPQAPWGVAPSTVPAYFGGEFDTADLIGLDADAVGLLRGRLVVGTLERGLLKF